MQLPRNRQIKNAYGPLIKEIRETNQKASVALEKGRYDPAQKFIGLSKQLSAYLDDVRALKSWFRQLRGDPAEGQNKGPTRKLWEYYVPVLRCLVDLGGKGTRKQIEDQFDSTFSCWLQPGDTQKMARAWRWQIMVHRTRKPLIEKGWIEIAPHRVWSITASGRRAAKKNIENDEGA
jgi:hypothetical protein